MPDTTMTDAVDPRELRNFRENCFVAVLNDLDTANQRIEGLERERDEARAKYNRYRMLSIKDEEGHERELSAERHARKQAEAKVAAVEKALQRWQRNHGAGSLEWKCFDCEAEGAKALAAPAPEPYKPPFTVDCPVCGKGYAHTMKICPEFRLEPTASAIAHPEERHGYRVKTEPKLCWGGCTRLAEHDGPCRFEPKPEAALKLLSDGMIYSDGDERIAETLDAIIALIEDRHAKTGR